MPNVKINKLKYHKFKKLKNYLDKSKTTQFRPTFSHNIKYSGYTEWHNGSEKKTLHFKI